MSRDTDKQAGRAFLARTSETKRSSANGSRGDAASCSSTNGETGVDIDDDGDFDAGDLDDHTNDRRLLIGVCGERDLGACCWLASI